eukprot:CAMPEP_0194116198 /NCGR_PEP_ID=MMETSP0150-20130528/26146_1 /TAXON_ID=122233 /ORGANISM="Chaetoceros debilis, Strain MM31A-1" /LENGTH=54 /DNA_ID=CAMNT_0038806857 /DNA_START=53 /DNA_END=214 /DNA_ORIENTATION=+
MDWYKDVIKDYKDDNGKIPDEGSLELNLYKHKDKVNDDIVEKVIAGMDKPQCDK